MGGLRGRGRGRGETLGMQAGGARGARLTLMRIGASDLPNSNVHCAVSGLERGSVRGSRSKSELARESLIDGLDCSSTLARPSPCDDAGREKSLRSMMTEFQQDENPAVDGNGVPTEMQSWGVRTRTMR